MSRAVNLRVGGGGVCVTNSESESGECHEQ